MPTNLELKARCDNTRAILAGVQALRAKDAGVLRQTDTYFCHSPGRLKLRETANSQAELIWYSRPNTIRNRYSRFTRIPVKNPSSFKRILSAGIGVKTVVRKQRRLYLFQNARIHVDRVERLGTFIEFEVQVTKGRKQAQRLLAVLEKAFSIRPASVLVSSYGDMMNRQRRKRQ